MRNTLQFGDIKSEEYGVYISGPGVYDAPARVYKSVSVPGRNGDLIISGDNYKNINVKYPAFIFKAAVRAGEGGECGTDNLSINA